MIYIVSALYIEAKPLIERYNLKKDNSFQKFQLFSNEKIKIIISGVGKIKSAIALTYLLANTELKKDDFILNLGFCASVNKEDKLLETVMISKISNVYSKKSFYPDMVYKHNFLEGTLLCYDELLLKYKKISDEKIYIDMESIGFFETASQFFRKDKIIVLKVISDILYENEEERKFYAFENENTFLETYKKIFEFIEKLEEAFLENENEFSENEKILIKKVRQNLRLSDTMYYELKNLLKYLKLSSNDIVEFMKKYENIEIKSKLEGKMYFEDIKKRIVE